MDLGLNIFYFIDRLIDFFTESYENLSYIGGAFIILGILLFLFGFRFFKGFLILENSLIMALGGFFIGSLFFDEKIFYIAAIGLFLLGLVIFGVLSRKNYRIGQIFMTIYSLVFGYLYFNRFILFTYIFILYGLFSLISIFTIKFGKALFLFLWEFFTFFIGFLFIFRNSIFAFQIGIVLSILGLIIQILIKKRKYGKLEL